MVAVQEEEFKLVTDRLENNVKDILIGIEQLAGTVDARFDQVDARFGQVDARFDRVETHVHELSTRVGSVEERLGKVEETTERTEQRLGKVEENVDKMGMRFGRAEKSFDRSEQQVKDLVTKVDLMSSRLSDQASDLGDLADQMTTVRQVVKVHSERFEGLAATLMSQRTMVVALDGKLDTIIEALGDRGSGSS